MVFDFESFRRARVQKLRRNRTAFDWSMCVWMFVECVCGGNGDPRVCLDGWLDNRGGVEEK